MKFFFHLNNSTGWTHDREGHELDGVSQALETAVEAARSLLCADIAEGKPVDLGSYIATDDEIGREVARVTFDEVVTFHSR